MADEPLKPLCFALLCGLVVVCCVWYRRPNVSSRTQFRALLLRPTRTMYATLMSSWMVPNPVRLKVGWGSEQRLLLASAAAAGGRVDTDTTDLCVCVCVYKQVASSSWSCS